MLILPQSLQPIAKWDESQHPRDKEGQFTKGWHLTSDPHFVPDPNFKPELNSLGGDLLGSKRPAGLFVGDPEFWMHAHGYERPYVAEVEGVPGPRGIAMYGKNSEQFIQAPFKVLRVLTIDEYARETYGEQGWVSNFFDPRPYHKIPKMPKGYVGRPVSAMSPEDLAEWERKFAEYARRPDGPHPAQKWDEAKHPRDKAGQFTEGGGAYFHGTSEHRLDSILKEGITTEHAGEVWPNMSNRDSVYLTGDPEDALLWGKNATRFTESNPEDTVVAILKVRIPEALTYALISDSHFASEEGNQAKQFRGSIPPSWIVGAKVRTRNEHSYGYTWVDVDLKKATDGQIVYVVLVLQSVAQKWDESKHPRDAEGQFTDVVFHGTDKDFSTFDFSHAGEATRAANGVLGAFFTTDVNKASSLYAGPRGVVIEAQLALKHPARFKGLEYDNDASARVNSETAAYVEKPLDDLTEDDFREWRDFLIRQGHDGIEVKLYQGETDYIVFDPKQIHRVQKGEHTYGSTHIMIDPWSSAATSLNTARNSIFDEDRAGPGKDVDPNHITVRFGLLNDGGDIDGLRSFIAAQRPFTARLDGIELFPPGEHSEGAVPVVARIDAPELHVIEANIARYAEFKEKSFPEYKPHSTIAYVTEASSPRYATLPVQGSCLVHSITISHQSGVQETIPFGMTQKKQWDPSKHPRATSGEHGGEFVEVLHSPKDALHSLINEEHVSMDPHDVRALLEIAAKQPWDPNLINLHVDGMQVFDRHGLGIKRDEMPQIPKDHRDQFLTEMREAGVHIVKEWVSPLSLSPTQDEISARNVGEKLIKYEKGKKAFPPLLVSADSRILDGHHHWGMMAAITIDDPSAKVPIYRLSVPVRQALALMHAYDKKHGIKRVSISGAAQKWDEGQHPRDEQGRWAGSGVLPNLKVDARNHTLTSDVGYIALRPTHTGTGFMVVDDVKVWDKYRRQGWGPRIYAEAASYAASRGYEGIARSQVESAEAIGLWQRLAEMRGFKVEERQGNQVLLPARVKKADPATGRYVTPFVSFEKQGDDQLRMIASLNSSRLATWGFTAEAEVRGLARYKLTAVLDGRTSKFCRMIDGKIFNVADARRKVIEVLNVQDPEDLRVVQPWPKQTKAAMAEYQAMTPQQLTERGLHIPPFHPYCRTILRPLKSSEGQLTETTPTVPSDSEIFQPVTQADLLELGVEASPEDVAQWNEHIGMTPTELLSKLSGMPPQEVLTKGKGLGSNPVQFTEDGGIGIRANGTTNGLEFKLKALLDPFTSTFYLTQADLEAGNPKAEVAFLRNLFKSIIEIGGKSSATAVALAVTGSQSAYYAKLGFLPDDIEWDAIRTSALMEIEAGALGPVLASLPETDRLLVIHLLQDKSVSALSALVDLPFTYQGKSIGEWVLGDVVSTWGLDLLDDAVLAQAEGYLS